MDENSIGLKKNKVDSKAEWVACPDYETADDNRSWFKFKKLFSTDGEKRSCVHARYCENWEYSELTESCAAGYWNWYDVDIED